MQDDVAVLRRSGLAVIDGAFASRRHAFDFAVALYVADVGQKAVAQTRLVSLAGLLGQRAWPAHEQLVARLIAYGRTHGAWDDADGYSEGSLARIVEAAAGLVPTLPSVKVDPGFLCGLEFDTLSAELAFFQLHGLDVEGAATSVQLAPGGLLIFDNLAVAHGRRGVRQPGELHQQVIGRRGLSPTAQVAIRDGARRDVVTAADARSTRGQRPRAR
jgi:hypothetical protein